MYFYETHLHTLEGSACGEVAAADYIDYMIVKGFTGMAVTDHFFNGNCAVDPALPWKRKVELYCDGFYKAREAAKDCDFDVIFGIEFNFKGDEYLIYGLAGEWLLDNEDIMMLDRRGVHKKVNEAGGIMVQAHPYREAHYINHIRLFPRSVHGVETVNSSQAELSNRMAELYAEQYHLLRTAGSDNHWGSRVFEKLAEKGYKPELAGMCSEEPLESVRDYIRLVREEKMHPFVQTSDGSYMPLGQGIWTL